MTFLMGNKVTMKNFNNVFWVLFRNRIKQESTPSKFLVCKFGNNWPWIVLPVKYATELMTVGRSLANYKSKVFSKNY